jgi:hypothetical protein
MGDRTGSQRYFFRTEASTKGGGKKDDRGGSHREVAKGIAPRWRDGYAGVGKKKGPGVSSGAFANANF